MHMLAYGTPADMWDENFRIGETTIIECMEKLCQGVIANFGEKIPKEANQRRYSMFTSYR